MVSEFDQYFEDAACFMQEQFAERDEHGDFAEVTIKPPSGKEFPLVAPMLGQLQVREEIEPGISQDRLVKKRTQTLSFDRARQTNAPPNWEPQLETTLVISDGIWSVVSIEDGDGPIVSLTIELERQMDASRAGTR